MSSEDITAVLLPSSNVDFFMSNGESVKNATQLKHDWRFSRIEVQIASTGIIGAIEKYKYNKSPELIVVEIYDIGGDFIQNLESLSALCAEGTDAIIIGPKNDVKLYRKLMEMGVKDYLVRPVDDDEIIKTVAKLLVDKKGLSGSKLISVIGCKGGVGTTRVAQLLAYDIAEKLENRTMLLDISDSSGTLGIVYGKEPVSSLVEAVRLADNGSEDDMRRICQSVSAHLSVLTCGSDSIMKEIPEVDKVESLIKRLMKRYPIVIADLSGTSREVQKRIVEISSEVTVVSSPIMSSLRNAKILLSEIKRLRSSLNEVSFIINKQGAAVAEEVPVQDIKSALDFAPSAIIEYKPKLFLSSETSSAPIGAGIEERKIMSEIREITKKIVSVKEERKEEVKGFSSIIEKIKGKIKE